LLRKLDKEARKSISGQKGQLLILADTKELERVIKASTGSNPDKKKLAVALKSAQIHARRLHEAYKSKNTRRYNAIVAKLPEVGLPHTLGVDMFIVDSFAQSITAIKKTMIQSLISSGSILESDAKDLSNNLHRGHGASGNAVSQVQIAASLSSLDEATKKLLLYNLEGSFRMGHLGMDAFSFREIKRLITTGSSIVTKKGKLNANYVSVISFQTNSDNIKDSKHEKAVKAVYRNFISDLNILDMKGSPSLRDKTASLVTDKFKGKKNIKVKAKSVKMKTKTRSKGKGSKAGAKVVLTATALRRRKASAKKDASAATSALGIMVLINKELPDAIKRNMNIPALQNQTGRFSESVEVVNAVTTKQGFPSFGYTYQKYPYQTFEQGFAQGSPERDPRKLIDKSMRQIAAKLAIGRFYTRRL
jgi:hypothetical protein